MMDNPNKIDKTLKGLVNNFKLMATRHVHPWYTWALVAVVLGFSIGVLYVSKQNDLEFMDTQAAGGVWLIAQGGKGGTGEATGGELLEVGAKALGEKDPPVIPDKLLSNSVGERDGGIQATADVLCQELAAAAAEVPPSSPTEIYLISNCAGSYVLHAAKEKCGELLEGIPIHWLTLERLSFYDCFWPFMKVGGLVSGWSDDGAYMCGGDKKIKEVLDEFAGWIDIHEWWVKGGHGLLDDETGGLLPPVRKAIKDWIDGKEPTGGEGDEDDPPPPDRPTACEIPEPDPVPVPPVGPGAPLPPPTDPIPLPSESALDSSIQTDAGGGKANSAGSCPMYAGEQSSCMEPQADGRAPMDYNLGIPWTEVPGAGQCYMASGAAGKCYY